MQDRDSKLKPCPFCGGEARTWEDFDGWRLYCTKCDATFRGGTAEELIEAWNKRTPTTEDILKSFDETMKAFEAMSSEDFKKRLEEARKVVDKWGKKRSEVPE